MERTEVWITKLDETDVAALYCHYSRQTQPQDCHLELDLETGELSADYNAEIGNAVPAPVWHGVVRRWGIPCLTAAAANELMAEIAPIAQRVLDGASVEWDGSNWIGKLDADAAVAEEGAEQLAGGCDGDTVCAVDACDWLDGGDANALGITTDTTDAELHSIGERISSEACAEGVHVIIRNLDDYLRDARDELRTAEQDQEADTE